MPDKLDLTEIFKVPKDEPYWCHFYPPVPTTPDMVDKMINVVESAENTKKREPPKWPLPHPCYAKNHRFDKIVDMKHAPAMIPEQIQEFLRREVYAYHNKIRTAQDDFIKNVIKDPYFVKGAGGYWNVRYMPIVWPDISNPAKNTLDERGHFNLAYFYCDYIRLGLEQLLMDETMHGNWMVAKFENLYSDHIRMFCCLRMAMNQLKLEEGYFDYSKDLNEFRYRNIASRSVTSLRTIITLRSCYALSYFIFNLLYRFRFNKRKGS